MRKKPNQQAGDSIAKQTNLAPRERVLQAALDLFYEHGVNSVGVDRIVAQSGVAKMTFYRHFPSKSKLVAEYLACKHLAWEQLLTRTMGDPAKPALDKLLAIFDALSISINEPGFRGCPFIKTLSEFGPEQNDPEVKQQIADHFAKSDQLVVALLAEIRPKDSAKFIQPILSLLSGTIVIAHVTGLTDVAQVNKELTRKILTQK